jgi:ribosome-associated protein
MTQELNNCQTSTKELEDGIELVRIIAKAADERKAGDLVVLKITDISYLADYFVIVTGFSTAQVRAIYDSIDDQVEKTFGQKPLRAAGKNEGNWILLDYGNVIVHIMLPQEREYYNLEAFWGHSQRIELKLE